MDGVIFQKNSWQTHSTFFNLKKIVYLEMNKECWESFLFSSKLLKPKSWSIASSFEKLWRVFINCQKLIWWNLPLGIEGFKVDPTSFASTPTNTLKHINFKCLNAEEIRQVVSHWTWFFNLDSQPDLSSFLCIGLMINRLKILPMTRFEPRIFGLGSDCSVNCATTTTTQDWILHWLPKWNILTWDTCYHFTAYLC